MSQPRPRPPAAAAGRQALAGPIPHSVGTTVLMWPVVAQGEYPAFGPHSWPPAYVDNLATGHLSRRHKLAFAGGDYRPYLVQAGRLAGLRRRAGRHGHRRRPAGQAAGAGRHPVLRSRGLARPRLAGAHPRRPGRGRPGQRVAGLGAHRAPRPGDHPAPQRRPDRRDRRRPAAAGAAGPRLRPGAVAARRRAASAAVLAMAARRLGCQPPACRLRHRLPGPGHRGKDQDYYEACPVLRVFDVVTGRLLSFPAPPGTAGWMPFEIGVTHAIAPGGRMIAAYAATRPLGTGGTGCT